MGVAAIGVSLFLAACGGGSGTNIPVTEQTIAQASYMAFLKCLDCSLRLTTSLATFHRRGVVVSIATSKQYDFTGSITYTEGWFTDYFTVQGTGSYSSPAYVRFEIQFNNLVYSDACGHPIGGNLRATAGAFIASVSFVESSCGTGFLSINNQPPTSVNLEAIEGLYAPCG